jgi:hypothetical protein
MSGRRGIWRRRLLLAAAGPASIAAALAESPVPRADLYALAAKVGFAIDADDPGALADAIERFELLIGVESAPADGVHPATAPMLALAAAAGRPPCPGWSVGALDPNEERTEIAVRFRGETYVEQAAFAHARIADCFGSLLYAAEPSPETGLVEVAADGSTRLAEDFDRLPAHYAPLRPYFDAVRRAKDGAAPGPAYRIFVDPEKRLDLVVSKPAPAESGDVVAAPPPTARLRREICEDLGLAAACLPETAIRKDAVYLDRGGLADGYYGRIAMPQSLIILSAPRAIVHKIGHDLAESTTLAFGLDALRQEARPRYLLPRFVSNDSPFKDPCGEGILDPTTEGETVADERDSADMTRLAPEVRKRVAKFWKTLLHWRDAPHDVFGGKRDVHTLVVDAAQVQNGDDIDARNRFSYGTFEPPPQSPPSGPTTATSHIDVNAPPSETFLSGQNFFVDQAPKNPPLEHARFAANVIASRKSLRIDAAKFHLGVAPARVSVSLASMIEFEQSLQDSAHGVLANKQVVAVVYTPLQPCRTANDREEGSYDAYPFGEFLRRALKKPVFVISAPQTPDETPNNSPCIYVNNTDLPYIEKKYEDSTYIGLDSDEYGELRQKPPFWAVMSGEPVVDNYGGNYIKCIGYHCHELSEHVIVVAALWDDGRPRKDSRLSFNVREGARTGKAFFAPGTDVVNSERRGAKEAFGMRCGTSFAGPVVAGVAANMLARWPTLTTAQVKQRLAATVDPGEDRVFKLVQANMAYGIVNLDRAVRSHPNRFTIWLSEEAEPVDADEIYIQGPEGEELLTEAIKRNPDWKDLIALIRPPNGMNAEDGEFLGVSWTPSKGAAVRWNDPEDDKPGDKDDWHSFNEIGNRFGTIPCADDESGCLRVVRPDGSSRPIAVGDISHIVFPVK